MQLESFLIKLKRLIPSSMLLGLDASGLLTTIHDHNWETTNCRIEVDCIAAQQEEEGYLTAIISESTACMVLW